MEANVGQVGIEPPLLEELFRRFHSFKGISAIVGLSEAEGVAHAAEDVLRALKQSQIEADQVLVDLLMTSTQFLEQCVLAFRADRKRASPKQIIHSLSALSTKTPQAGSKAVVSSPSSSGSAPLSSLEETPGLLKWKCVFVPSKSLDEQGINLNFVRAKLSKSGQILSSAPEVRSDGSLAFVFILATRDTPSDVADWESIGLATALLETQLPEPLANLPDRSFESEQNPFIAPSHVIRVDLKRMDELMRIVGEMVIQKSRSDQALTQASRGSGTVEVSVLKESNLALTRNLRDLRQALMKVRLVPVAEIFARMPFVTRDLARETNKKARLLLKGQQTEIDKYLIEKLKEPLLHLVRNAFSHGIESPQERTALGKLEVAVIELKASTIGDFVLIQIKDDGRGVDRQAVAKKAAALGIPIPSPLDNRALLDILCSPGFSIRDEADRAAGRGVGMSVVQKTIHELGGTISLETTDGSGAEFSLRLPLTLAVAETIIVSSHGQTCAIPQSFVAEVLRISPGDIRPVNRVMVIPYKDSVLPVISLGAIFGFGEGDTLARFVLVLTAEKGSVGLVVREIHGQKEVVVRAMQDPLIQVPGITGATELGDGKAVLILNAAVLFNGPVRPPQKPSLEMTTSLQPAL